MELKLLNAQGQADGTTPAPETLFGREYNEALVHQIVGGLPGQRASGHAGAEGPDDGQALDPQAVASEGHRPRARRHVVEPDLAWGRPHVPELADENFTQKVNKKMYRAGMTSILSQLARDGRIAVVDGLSVDSPKTKPLAEKLKAMGLESVLIITEAVDENLYLASRNLKNVMVVEPRYADPLSLIHYKNVVVTKPAIAKLEEMWG